MAAHDPQPLSQALAELIALRGFARSRAETDLRDAWDKAAGPDWAGKCRPIKITRGTLYVDVRSPAVLGQLTAFHGPELTQRMQQAAPHLRIRTIKFRLAGT